MKYENTFQTSFFFKKLNKNETSYFLVKLPFISNNQPGISTLFLKYYSTWRFKKVLKKNRLLNCKVKQSLTQKTLWFYSSKGLLPSFLSSTYGPSFVNRILRSSILTIKATRIGYILNTLWSRFIRSFVLNSQVLYLFTSSLDRLVNNNLSKYRFKSVRSRCFYTQRLL